MKLRVATWNIHACVGGDGRMDPGRIADVLGEIDADVVGLQEVDWRHPPTRGLDQLAYLADRLDMLALPGPNLSDHRGDYGNGVLTRLVPAADRRIDLSVERHEPRGAIDVRFRIGSRTLRLLATHLGLRRHERAFQAGRLRQLLAREPRDDARILLGDLNEWRPLRRARIGLDASVFPFASSARTFPSRLPALALDRILADPQPRRAEARVVATRAARRASDHLPVVADLEWACGD